MTSRSRSTSFAARFALADGATVDAARELTWVAQRTSCRHPGRGRASVRQAAIAFTSSAATTDEATGAVDQAAKLVGDDPVLGCTSTSPGPSCWGRRARSSLRSTPSETWPNATIPQQSVHADAEARLLLLEAMYAGGLRQRGRQVASVAVAEARANGALGDLHVALACRFSIELAAARFDAAEDAAAEELELASGFGRTAERREALGHLAWCDAVKGREVDCRGHLRERQELSERMGRGACATSGARAPPARARRRSAAGACLTAVEEFEAVRRVVLRLPACDPTPSTSWRLCSCRPARHGRRHARHVRKDARRLDRPLAMALACRGRGMLASGDDADGAFEESLRWDSSSRAPFESARTQLVWGEHLRRRRMKGVAAEQLESARSAFERFGADLWVATAERELAANGQRVRPRHGTGAALTSRSGGSPIWSSAASATVTSPLRCSSVSTRSRPTCATSTASSESAPGPSSPREFTVIRDVTARVRF